VPRDCLVISIMSAHGSESGEEGQYDDVANVGSDAGSDAELALEDEPGFDAGEGGTGESGDAVPALGRKRKRLPAELDPARLREFEQAEKRKGVVREVSIRGSSTRQCSQLVVPAGDAQRPVSCVGNRRRPVGPEDVI
jgi:hypothetical protein